MTTMKATLTIPGGRMLATIASDDGKQTYFKGDEDQAARITLAIPPMVGSNMYTVSAGNLHECIDALCLKIEDGAGLGNDVEIEFTEDTVRRVSVVWHQ